jgi:hypothetical protein
MIGKQQHKSKENAQSFIHFFHSLHPFIHPIHPFFIHYIHPFIPFSFITSIHSSISFIHYIHSFIHSSVYSSTSSISVIHSYLKEDLLEVTKRRGRSSSSSKMWIHFPTKKICSWGHKITCCVLLPITPSLSHSSHKACACCKINCNFCLSSVPSLPTSLTHSLTHNRVICLLSKLIATRVCLLLHSTRESHQIILLVAKLVAKLQQSCTFFFPSVALIHHMRAELLVVKLQPWFLLLHSLTHSDQSMCLSQNWNFYFLLVALVYHIKAKLLVAKL